MPSFALRGLGQAQKAQRRWVSIPVSANSPGKPGQQAYDPTTGAIYVCYALNAWKKFTGFSPFGLIPLTYVSDGDTNGVFTYMGTTAGVWSNPVTSGVLVIAASNLGSGTLAALVDHVASDTFDNPMTNNWFSFDLGANRSLLINKWSYRDRNTSATFPTAIDLQGSNDNSIWTTLDSRTGITGANSAWHSFTVSGVGAYYRYFRLVKTALANDGQNHFCLGEVELYGTLST